MIIICLPLILMANKCNNEDAEEAGSCITKGKVVDMTGMDGCGLMIELEDGKKLQVTVLPEGMELVAGQHIRFDYEKAEGMGICMMGEMVKISCLEVIESETEQSSETCTAFNFGDVDSAKISSAPYFKVYGYRTAGTLLYMDIGYSGCNRDRDFQLEVSKLQMRSMPPQNNAVLLFEDQACEAFFRDTLCFEMKELGMETILLFHQNDSTERIRYQPY